MTTQNFHLNYLSTEFAKRIQRNPHYSLRSFARDLGVPPSWLSEFLNAKKGMSLTTAEKICRSLNLSLSETELFLLGVRAAHARNPKDRAEAAVLLKKYKKTEAFNMKPADFIEIDSWYHQSILELTEVEDFAHTENDIAQRLRLPAPTVKRAVASLQKFGLLKIKDGRMLATYPETESSLDTPSLAMRKYQEQILQKGANALHEQPNHMREFMSVTFAFEAERIAEAKKALRQFQKQFSSEFYNKSERKNSVYQFSLQFFRMDQKGS